MPVNAPTPKGFNAVTDIRDVTVKCTNKECRAIEDPKNFAHDAALIQEENEIAKRRVGNRGRRREKSQPIQTDGVLVGETETRQDHQAGTDAVAEPA